LILPKAFKPSIYIITCPTTLGAALAAVEQNQERPKNRNSKELLQLTCVLVLLQHHQQQEKRLQAYVTPQPSMPLNQPASLNQRDPATSNMCHLNQNLARNSYR